MPFFPRVASKSFMVFGSIEKIGNLWNFFIGRCQRCSQDNLSKNTLGRLNKTRKVPNKGGRGTKVSDNSPTAVRWFWFLVRAWVSLVDELQVAGRPSGQTGGRRGGGGRWEGGREGGRAGEGVCRLAGRAGPRPTLPCLYWPGLSVSTVDCRTVRQSTVHSGINGGGGDINS